MDRREFEHILAGLATRRRLLGVAGAAAVSYAGRPTRILGAFQATPQASPVAGANPFTLGVASGDPLPDSAVIWTRLAPDPVAADGLGGMVPAPIEVRWEIASDDGFRDVVQSGSTAAVPELAHSVHVDVTGLEPARDYFYRFLAGSEISPAGRTRTAPAANAPLDRFRFAFATCQDYQAGFYTPYTHLLAEDVDAVFFLGDYIYEYPADPAAPRQHVGGLTVSLSDYRNRLALYKTDADLQAVHAAFPWIVTWDDHEIENDYAGAYDQAGSPVEQFLARRADGYQAFYEHMPLRPESMPTGAAMQLYRRFTFGDLIEFSVLDTRQYRSDHPCGEGEVAVCPAAEDPATTMTGPEQERWLLDGLSSSRARWNVLAQQVLMAQLDHTEAAGEIFWQDGWDGYPAARRRVLNALVDQSVSNPVVITGDWHCAFVNDLKLDFSDETAAPVATEFVVTSVSSQGDSTSYGDYYGPMIPWNPNIKFFADRRGYQTVEVTPERWTTDLKMVGTVLAPEAPIETVASFVVENGRPGAVPA